MSRARDPTDETRKEKAFVMWLQAGGVKAPKGTLNKIAKVLGVTSGTVRGWKSKENWENKCNVADVATVVIEDVATKKKKEVENTNIIKANEMYLAGASANKIAKTIQVNTSTVCRWISRYKWKETRERLLIKVTDELFKKHKRERFKERESSYRYAGLIRMLAIQKLTGKEYSIGEDGEKVLLPKLKGKVLAAEMSALTMAMKLIEDTNNFQDRILGIKNMDNLLTDITNEYKDNIKQIFEEKKLVLSTDLKILELEHKYSDCDGNNGNTDLEDLEKELDEWTEEAWNNEENNSNNSSNT